MSIAVKSGLPSLGSTEGAVISADEVSVSEDGSAAASVGEDLPRGKSAYEIAKENGFNGTETEWLASLKGEPGAAGASGKDGENGKTPYVGDNGNWYIGADDTGKPSRGAKGEKGEKGDTGAQGIQGEQGIQGVQGEKGDKGEKGAQGPQGLQGPPGEAGADGKTPYVGDNGNWFVGSDDTGKPSRGEKGEPGSPGAKGDKGDPGATPNLTIGSVTTLEAGQNATASMGGTAESPVLNLGIPRGAKGEPGEGGGGTDISLGLTSAAVGQIIKVKAIDASGKPTAWEAANMQSGDRWELINAIEIPDGAEETNALTISADKNGNAFSLKKARLITYFPKYTGESSIPGYSFTMINGFNAGPQSPICYTAGLPVPNNSKNPGGWLEVDLSMPGYQVERVARFAGSGNSPAELMYWGARRLNGAETITSIGGTNMLIYPGCKFTLYGVRA